MRRLKIILLVTLLLFGCSKNEEYNEIQGIVRVPMFRDWEAKDIRYTSHYVEFYDSSTNKKVFVTGNFVIQFGETYETSN